MLTDRPELCTALDAAMIAHLTAVSPSGQPQTTPVWFLRDGDELVVYNKPKSPRLDSVASNDRVSLTLRGDAAGDGAVTIEGRARVDDTIPPAHEWPEYIAKYGKSISGLGWTPQEFAEGYSVAITITPTRVRAWGVDRVIAAEG